MSMTGYGPPPGAAQALPPGIMSLLASQHPTDQDDAGPSKNDGGLSCLQDVMSDFPKLLQELTDPGDVHMASQSLQLLAKIQSRLMASQGQGASGGPSAQGS